MNISRSLASALLVAWVSGCSGDGARVRVPPLEKTADSGAAADGFSELVGYDWTVAPSVEAYYCGYKTLKDDLYINDFRPVMPKGTHHVLVGYQDPAHADGFVPADPALAFVTSPSTCTGVTWGDILTFAATVGSQGLTMPEGVAVKIPAGKQLVFGLHVINTGTDPLSGHSGVDARLPDPAKVENIAEVIVVDDINLSVPPGKSTAKITCTMTGDTTVFALSPHMHLSGTHMTATAGPPAGPTTTLLDAAYDFNTQRYQMMDPPVAMKQGDQINVACDYDNAGPSALPFGESTLKNEMCIAFAYRYPALSLNAAAPDPKTSFALARAQCVK